MIAVNSKEVLASANGLHIRRATPADLWKIALVTWQILVKTGRAQVYRFRDVVHGVHTVLHEPGLASYYIAEHNRQFAGQLKLVRSWHDLFNREVATIEHVYVRPACRGLMNAAGQRVYQQLHAHAVEVCRQHHVVQVQLHVVRDNQRAQRASEKQGMDTTGYWMTQRLG